MKSLLQFVLLTVTLFEGCYSFRGLSEEEKSQNRPRDDEEIVVKLKNGTEITSAPFQHATVTAPSEFVMGIGQKKETVAGENDAFMGTIPRSSVDSIRSEIIQSHEYVWCYLPGGSQVRFSMRYAVHVTPDSGTGLWCIGTMKKGSQRDSSEVFKGRIAADDISNIEVNKFDGGKLALGIAGATVGLLFVAAATLGNTHYPFRRIP
jgi:hypothetical protein